MSKLLTWYKFQLCQLTCSAYKYEDLSKRKIGKKKRKKEGRKRETEKERENESVSERSD